MEETQPTFASDHIYLVAFLTCCGHSVVSTSRENGRIAFEFSKTQCLLSDVARFMSGAAIPARQFSFELLKIKRMLYGGQSRLKRVSHDEGEELSYPST